MVFTLRHRRVSGRKEKISPYLVLFVLQQLHHFYLGLRWRLVTNHLLCSELARKGKQDQSCSQSLCYPGPPERRGTGVAREAVSLFQPLVKETRTLVTILITGYHNFFFSEFARVVTKRHYFIHSTGFKLTISPNLIANSPPLDLLVSAGSPGTRFHEYPTAQTYSMSTCNLDRIRDTRRA